MLPFFSLRAGAFVVSLALLAACGEQGPDSMRFGGASSCAQGDVACDPASGSDVDSGGSAAGSGGPSLGSGSDVGDTGDSGDSGADTKVTRDCARVELRAELVKKPVDIVWVIDSSPSMDNEAATVQSNMNAFAQGIAASGLDYRVVVISEGGFIDVPDPLGSDAEHFLFVEQQVDSNAALDVLVNRFSSYGSFLRAGAITHFVVVTDDEARLEGGLFDPRAARVTRTRDRFASTMGGLLGGDFTLHAVASEVAGTFLGIDRACSGAAAPGKVYYALAAQTGGLTFSVCASDWSALFDQLTTEVVASSGVSCSIPMPEPPPGLSVNPEQVSVLLDAGVPLGRIAGASACDGGGWYFDRPLLPRFIELCPSTCEEVNAAADTALDVTVDCGSNACSGVSVQADVRETPVDIVLIVDSSGSMDNEAAIVQEQLNAFAAAIGPSGIDYRVVVISTRSFISVPNPLGSDEAHFRFVEQFVDSDASLDLLLSTFDAYADFLRPNAKTHFVVVSDDEARHEGGSVETAADWFLAQMGGAERLGHAFTLHAIVSEDLGSGERCSGPHGAAAAPGLTYIDLAGRTGGELFSICTADWTPLFEGLARAVLSSSPIACSFDLPAPPEGKVLVPDEVNVRFASHGAESITVLGRVGDGSKCAVGGWFYDQPDAPTKVTLCEVTCEAVQEQLGGALEVELGCASEVVPPLVID